MSSRRFLIMSPTRAASPRASPLSVLGLRPARGWGRGGSANSRVWRAQTQSGAGFAHVVAVGQHAGARRASPTRTFRAARYALARWSPFARPHARQIRERCARHGTCAVKATLGALPRPALREVSVFARHLVSPARAAWLEEHARRMRFAPTSSEATLWRELSGSKLGVWLPSAVGHWISFHRGLRLHQGAPRRRGRWARPQLPASMGCAQGPRAHLRTRLARHPLYRWRGHAPSMVVQAIRAALVP